MFRSLWRVGLGLMLNKAAAHCHCPSCAEPLQRPLALPPHELDGVLACPACGHRASLLNWAPSTGGFSTPEKEPDGSPAPPMEQPSYSEIQRLESKDGSVVWNIPRGSGGSFLFVFAVLWNLISWVITLSFFMSDHGDLAGPTLLVFLFPVIGIFLLYWGVLQKFSTHLLGVGSAGVLLERKLFNTRKRITLPPGTITSVEMKVFYQQNYEPVYGIEIRGATGKIRFGSGLDEDEKVWLCQEIRGALGLDPEDSAPGKSSVPGTAKAGRTGKAPKRSFQVSESGGRIEIVTSGGNFSWLPAVIGVAFLGAAAFLLYGAIDSFAEASSGDGFFRALDLIFSIIPFVMGLAFGAAGAVLLGVAVANRSSRSVLRVTSGEAIWSRLRRGRESARRHLSRHEIHDVRVVCCPYEVNHIPSFRGEVVGTEFVLPFGFYCDAAELRIAAGKIRRLLALPESTLPEDISTS